MLNKNLATFNKTKSIHSKRQNFQFREQILLFLENKVKTIFFVNFSFATFQVLPILKALLNESFLKCKL